MDHPLLALGTVAGVMGICYLVLQEAVRTINAACLATGEVGGPFPVPPLWLIGGLVGAMALLRILLPVPASGRWLP